MKNVVIKLLLLALVAYIFTLLGWVSAAGDKPIWLIVLIIALVIFGLGYLISLAATYLTFLSGGCLLIVTVPLLMIANWLALILGAHLTKMYTVNVDFWWQGLIMALVLGTVNFQFSASFSYKTTTTLSVDSTSDGD